MSVTDWDRDYDLLAQSYLFDAEWYLGRYPDVHAGLADPIAHYLLFGADEHRDPGPAFSTFYYFAENPDVAAGGMNPLAHYLRQGADEGRSIPMIRAIQDLLEPEVKRLATRLASSDLFDPVWYLTANPDVAQADVDAATHYIMNGGKELRDPGPNFNTQAYLAANPAALDSRLPPLLHYLQSASHAEFTSDTACRIWFFVGDTLEWIENGRRLSGVGHVTVALFRAALKTGTPIHSCDADAASLSLREISNDYVAHRLENQSESKPTTGISPSSGDHVFLSGVIWTPRHVEMIRSFAAQGIRFSTVIYDIIPILHPEFVGSNYLNTFREWLRVTLTTSIQAYLPSQQVMDDVMRWATLEGVPIIASLSILPFGPMKPGAPKSEAYPVKIEDDIDEENFVLCVGTIDLRKNQRFLCGVWARLIVELGPAVPQLVFAGRADLDLGSLNEATRTLISQRRIIIVDDLSDQQITRLYSLCRFTVFASGSEGYGLPVAESLQMGKVCISSDLPCIREHAGALPWYFDVNDEDRALRLVREAVEEPARVQDQEKRISSEYTCSSWESSWLTIYGSLSDPDQHTCRKPTRQISVPSLPINIPVALMRARETCVSERPVVSIILTMRDSDELVRQCIRQIWENTDGIAYEIIVVDNGSRTDLADDFSSLGKGVSFIPLGCDRLFSEANNIGAERATGDFLCFLDSATFVQRGWLQALVAELRATANAVAAGPLVYYPNSQFREAGGIVDDEGFRMRRGRQLRSLSSEDLKPCDVDYVSSSAFVVRRDAFLRVGGFHLYFEPNYYEDVDLCHRLKLLGGTVRYCPTARVVRGEKISSAPEQVLESHLLDDNRRTFLERKKRPPKPRTMLQDQYMGPKSALIYTPYLLTPGGGERALLSLATFLSGDYRITIVTKHLYSKLRVRNLFDELGLKLFDFDVISEYELDRRTVGSEIMVALSNSVIPSTMGRARDNYFICQFPFPEDPAMTWARKSVLSSYRACITYSDYSRAHVVSQLSSLSLKQLPVHVIYPLVPSIAGYRALKQRSMILSVGRFVVDGPNKRHVDMISAFRDLLSVSKIPGLELHLAGSSLPDEQHRAYIAHLRDVAKELPVIFHVNPSIESLHSLYRRATLYWHAAGFGVDLEKRPFEAEHFGMSIVEAMSAECIPVAFNAGGPREIIVHGENGFLFATLKELVEVSDRLLAGSLLGDRGRVGRKAAVTAGRFSSDRAAKEWSALVKHYSTSRL